jgi:transposase
LTLSEYLQEQHGLLAELARQELADIGNFSTLIDSLTENIADRAHKLDSTLLLLPGCAELTAAKLISEVANMDRFRSEAAFARYVGIAPVPLSSGSTGGGCGRRDLATGNATPPSIASPSFRCA